jgi:hypothetical protein
MTYATTETSGTTPRGCPRAHACPHWTAATEARNDQVDGPLQFCYAASDHEEFHGCR